MKPVSLLILMSFIFFLSAFAQEKKNISSADFDIGLCFAKIEHPSIPVSPFSFPPDSSRHQLYYASFFSLGLYARAVYIFPQWSVGFFVKPGLGANFSRGDHSDPNMLILQLPFCAASEIGKTDGHGPGLVAGGGITFNYYEFTGYKIPPIGKPLPYFFIQAHIGPYGLRFSEIPNQRFINKNGTITKTHADFQVTIIVTMPADKKHPEKETEKKI